jgi:hypothetical protein
VSDDRPVRLTFPSFDIGSASIMADGKHQTGLVLGEFWLWRAYLWPVADARPSHVYELETVAGQTLADVRRVLRERVAQHGPWWKA